MCCTGRSNVAATVGGAGADAPAHIAEGSAGQSVKAVFLPSSTRKSVATAMKIDSRKAHREPTGSASSHNALTQKNGTDRRHKQHSHARDGNTLLEEPAMVNGVTANIQRASAQHRTASPAKRRGRSRSPSRARTRPRHSSPDHQGDEPASLDAADHVTLGVARQAASNSNAAERAARLEILKEGRSLGLLAIPLAMQSTKCVIGRAPGCGIVLEHASISRHHAELSSNARGELFVTDLSSGNQPAGEQGQPQFWQLCALLHDVLAREATFSS